MEKSKLLLLLLSSLSAVFHVSGEEILDYYVEYLPETSFTCTGKVNGGYYADVETQCKMYHICSRTEDGFLEDNKFLCGNGTVFDQRRLVCQDSRRVRCHDSPNYYRKVAVHMKELDVRTDDVDRTYLEAPSYSMEFLPQTSFSCNGKVNGGYYADVEAQCQLYHICSKNKNGFLEDIKFLCGNGTVFDQKKLVCRDFHRVRCQNAPRFYKHGSLLEQPKTTAEEYYHHYLEPPSYSMDFLPETRFSCKGKVNGGYYADVEGQCQLYHVCSRNKDGALQDNKFLCGNGTVFDQRKLVCQDFYKVRCDDSPRFYRNVATLLEELEAKRLTAAAERRLAANANLELGRLS